MVVRLEDSTKPKAEEDEEIDVPKVYYTSRTHTQLRQLTSELLKTGFVGGIPEGKDDNDTNMSIRAVPLGGRAQLCINAKVSISQRLLHCTWLIGLKVREVGRTKGGDRMNEACLDLQKAGTIVFYPRRSRPLAQAHLVDSKSGRCPYLPPKDKEERLLDFRDQILVCEAIRTD